MSEVEAFLTAEAEAEVVAAIQEAERLTSGEIRVHLEHTHRGDPLARAKEVFRLLKMDNTRERNGVLLYIAVHDHRFVILGDRGIDRAVPKGFWDSTRDLIQEHFKNGDFRQGILAGIRSAGEELQAHFPWTPDDQNELDNAISKN
ncbi:TPM domain-containing protein [Robiginitalea sp. M366]|uniref:TPM domain-containing protein n=1 Tax=Robiginitalea aestuariiviva TaxID=3036903 RepID=UPI00240D3D58|nr:TPM domain-containing protein [Robiginitalea aestuariiviva]MDG1571961.1 TPM domain-containing protein [Robiginitalea aestuariiviva]